MNNEQMFKESCRILWESMTEKGKQETIKHVADVKAFAEVTGIEAKEISE